MHLSKSERIYKKKLFRYIKVKKKSTQKELTAIIVKTKLYKCGGFKQVYSATKYGIVKLSNAIIHITNTVRSATKALCNLVNSLNLIRSQNIKNEVKTI